MAKKRNRKWMNLLLTFALVFSLVPQAFVQAESNTDASASQISPELLKSIKDRYMKNRSDHEGTKIDSNINVNSDEKIKVIVEFEAAPIAVQRVLAQESNQTFSAKQAKDTMATVMNNFKKDITLKISESTITNSFDTVFSGVSLEIKASDVPKLQTIPGVRAIYPNNKVQAIPVEKSTENKPYMAESAPMIGADKYWNLGYEGAGMKVGVIDTGIDYNHPDLKEAYKGGYDFVDNDNNPYEGDYEVQSMHGTHVSGIIGGRGNPDTGGVRGVAPKSDLHVYRVLGDQGGYDSWVIAGIEQSVKDGMDVINLSLGAADNNPDSPTSRAVNNAMLAGVVTVVANGNFGGYGYGTVTTPATAALGISVGASFPPYHSYLHSGVASATGDKQYNLNWMLDWDPKEDKLEFLNQEHELEYVGFGRPQDYEGKDVRGKVVLVKFGTEMGLNRINEYAESMGAVAAIVFNVDVIHEHINFPFPRQGNIPMFDMRGDDGRQLVKAMSANETNTFKLTGVVKDTYPGDDVVDFSSKGPVVRSFDMKPDIVAPGANILSTVPAFGEDYSKAYMRAAGTSMAAPHVAGLSALILEAQPSLSTFDVKTLLMNTAKKLTPILRDKRYDVLEQGAGRIQAEEILKTPVLAQVKETAQYTKDPLGAVNIESVEHWTGSLNFGVLTEELTPKTKTVTLKNLSDKSITYQLTSEINQLYRGAEDPGDGDIIISGLNNAAVTDSPVIEASMTFSANEVVVPANGITTFDVTYHSPSHLNEAYDGYVYLTPVNSENVPDLQIPFIGYHNTGDFITGIGYMGFNPKFLSLNGDGLFEETTMSYEFLYDMKEAYLIIEDTLDWERRGPLGFVKIQGDNLKYGEHSIVWDGYYIDFETGEKKVIHSSLYGIDLVAYDYQDNEYYDNEYTSFIVQHEPTDIQVNGANENNRIEVTENKISGLLSSTVAEIARDWYFMDDAFWNVLKLDYKVKVEGEEYSKGSLILKNMFDTPEKMVEFDLEGELPAGESILELTAWDKAGNKNVETYSVWYDADTSIKAPKEVSYGSPLKLTLSALQVKELVGAEFFLEFRSDVFKFDGFEVTEEFAALGNVLTPSVTDAPVRVDEEGREFQILQLGAALKQDPNEPHLAGITGNVPVLNVFFTPRKDVRYLGEHNFTITKAQKVYREYSAIVKAPLEGTFHPVEVYTNPVSIKGKIKLEAFLDENGEMRKDISLGNLYDLEANISIFDHETKRYIPHHEGYRPNRMGERGIPIEFNIDGTFEIQNLHPGKTYDIKIFYPSHFEIFVENIITTVDAIEGRKVGVEEVEVNPDLALAGDLDHNHVVDIYDVALTSLLFGLKTVNGEWSDVYNYYVRYADINKDGEIDILDLSFTTTNYGKINSALLNGNLSSLNTNPLVNVEAIKDLLKKARPELFE